MWKSYFSFSQKWEIKEKNYFLIKHNQLDCHSVNHSFSLYLSGPFGIKNLCNFSYSLWHVHNTLHWFLPISVQSMKAISIWTLLPKIEYCNQTKQKQPSQSAKTRNKLSNTYFFHYAFALNEWDVNKSKSNIHMK